jgi:hypothetical protein
LTKFFAILNLLGLFSGAAGGLFLFYSLTIRPSSFRLVKTGHKELAICLDDKKIVAGFGGPLVVSEEICPDMEKTGPTPEVVADRPKFVVLGIVLIIVGFAFQLPAGFLVLRAS